MSLTKDRVAITQLTAAGTSTVLDVTGSYFNTLLVRHVNGAGTVTVAGSFLVQVQAANGTIWYPLNNQGFQASTTTGATDYFTIRIPKGIAKVQLVYTPPTGATGFTLDAEIAEETGQ